MPGSLYMGRFHSARSMRDSVTAFVRTLSVAWRSFRMVVPMWSPARGVRWLQTMRPTLGVIFARASWGR